MKQILVVLIALFITNIYGQTTDQELDNRIKKEYKRIGSLTKEEYDKIDYSKFVKDIEAKVEENPENTEARYFLGYAYGQKNSYDANDMIHTNLDLVMKASEQFEEIIKLTPKYSGEIIGLNPYDKIAAEWGSLAIKYLYEQKKDSAIWAFKEAKKRGGFNTYTLQLNKERLLTCSKDAVLLSSGDIPTYSLYFLQTVENIRNDVTVIDVELLNSTWYPEYLLDRKSIDFGMSSEELQTINYLEWTDKEITIGDFSWILKPSYGEYLLRGNRILLSFLKQNKFQRDIYFTIGFNKEGSLSLEDSLAQGLVLDKLAITKADKEAFKVSEESLIKMVKMTKYVNINNDEEVNMVYFFRIMCVYEMNDLFEKMDKETPKKLMNLIDTYIDEDAFPYRDKDVLEFIQQCRKFFNN
ncbi:tetratricopeptide repeat protein [Kordia sp.]|uniref:tetratricopeptide repeat protein n=1 Tax=Kordia sp. TaxID=1965332 RepID=UPI003D6A8248